MLPVKVSVVRRLYLRRETTRRQHRPVAWIPAEIFDQKPEKINLEAFFDQGHKGHTMRMLIFGALGLFIVACISNPSIDSLSPSELETLKRIQILEGEIYKPFDVIAEVKGKSCHTTIDQSRELSTGDAIEGIKINAAKRQADAVINIVCKRDRTMDWRNDCWSSMVCVGTAIKFKQD